MERSLQRDLLHRGIFCAAWSSLQGESSLQGGPYRDAQFQTSDQGLVMKAITVSLVKCEHFQSQTETKIRPKVRSVFNVLVSKTDHVYAKDELHTGPLAERACSNSWL